MRSAVRVLAGVMVAAVLLSGCDRFRKRAPDAGVVAAVPPRPVTTPMPQTSDGWRGVGTLWLGASGSQGAVLLLHQLGSNRSEWGMLVERLQQPPAVTVLAIDLRGHGESVTHGPESTRQTWESFGEDQALWNGLARDAQAAAQYLFEQGRVRSLVVVGSSIGASAAVAGLADEARVVGLAMISPGVDYHGVDIRDPMDRYVALRTFPPRTLWMMAGEGDVESAQALTTLATTSPTALTTGAPTIAIERLRIAGSDAHGVALLNEPARRPGDPHPRLDALERYIRTAVGAPRRAAAAPH